MIKGFSTTRFDPIIEDRSSIIQKIIEQIEAEVYLEIGIYDGWTFRRIVAPQKIGIDINLRHYVNCDCHEISSDDFFKQQDYWFSKLSYKGYDVVFIDGFHSYEQSLKDFQNSLRYLNSGGIIILHDCNPASEANSLDFLHTGTVWKTIVNIRSNYNDLNVFVLDCDEGLGIIRRGEPNGMLSYSLEEIQNFSYNDLEKNRNMMLNLKNLAYFNEIIKKWKKI